MISKSFLFNLVFQLTHFGRFDTFTFVLIAIYCEKVTKSLIPPLTNISNNFILFVYIKFTTLKLQYRQKALILSIFDHNYWKKLNFWFKRPQKQNS